MCLYHQGHRRLATLVRWLHHRATSRLVPVYWCIDGNITLTQPCIHIHQVPVDYTCICPALTVPVATLDCSYHRWQHRRWCHRQSSRRLCSSTGGLHVSVECCCCRLWQWTTFACHCHCKPRSAHCMRRHVCSSHNIQFMAMMKCGG